MHKGAQDLLAAEHRQPYSRRALLMDVGVALLYTILIVVLIKLGVLQPITDYFAEGSTEPS